MKKFLWVCITILIFVIFYSCGKDEGVSNPKIPSITSFTPTSGLAGTSVTITGINFGNTIDLNRVTFGGVAAKVSKASPTKLTVIVPNGAITGKISLTVGESTALSLDEFTVEVETTGAEEEDENLEDNEENDDENDNDENDNENDNDNENENENEDDNDDENNEEEESLTLVLNKEELTLYPYPNYAESLEIISDIGEESVTWESSDDLVATIDQDGLVTPLKIGVATITATVGESVVECIVNVEDGPVTKLELNTESLEMKVNDVEKLTITTFEADVENTGVPVWSSDNPDIVEVDQQGNVTALNSGYATVTVSVDNATASADITVEKEGFIIGGINVFVGGNIDDGIRQKATIWKNGEVIYSYTPQSRDGSVNSIYVVGSDVYATGYEEKEFIKTAKVWKNGDELYSFGDGISNYEGVKIFVENNNVYVAGSSDGKKVTKVWKNGNDLYSFEPENGSSYTYSMAVNNGFVYTMAYQGSVNDGALNVWRNSTKINSYEFDGNSGLRTGKIYVEDGNLYVGALEKNNNDHWVKILKNGSELYSFEDLNDNSQIDDIYVSNGDVFWVGNYGNGLVHYNKLYKNAVLQYTLNPQDHQLSIQQYVNEIYTTGENSSNKMSIWKNGEILFEDQGNGNYTSIGKSIFVNFSL